MERNYMIITFSSKHQAIHFERLLLGRFAIEMIPTPRDITASCGLSLKFEKEDLSSILEVLKSEDLTGKQLYEYIEETQIRKMITIGWEDAYAAKA